MNKYLLASFLMLNLAMSCEQPYEEVLGYKLGCPIENVDSMKLIDSKEFDGRAQVYAYKASNGFFNNSEIGVLDGNVSLVHISGQGRDAKTIFKNLLVQNTDKWGEPKLLSKEDGFEMWEFTPNNSILGTIQLMFEGNSNISSVYMTKEFSQLYKEKYE